MVRKGLRVLLAALLVPALAAAYTMVLKDGRKIEAQSRYRVESGQVKFTGADGRAYQFPLGQVDLAATNRANQSRQPKVWYNEDLERLAPLRAELAQIEQQLTELRSNQGKAASNTLDINTNAPGADVQDTIRRLEQRRTQLQQQIEDVQLEAKRKGIAPGRLR